MRRKKCMKEKTIFLSVTLMVVLFAFGSMGTAQTKQKRMQRCDLVVESVELDAQCQIKVVIKNQGAGPVADAAYYDPPHHGVVIQASSGNTGWGGYNLNGFDRLRKLKTPGGKVSFTGFKRPLNPQEVLSLKVEIINPNNVANESNLNNNSKTVRLICRKKQCDLIVDRIELDKDCKIKVTIKNQGSGAVADAAYYGPPHHGVIIQASTGNAGWGGYILDAFDKLRKLKTPGGKVSFTGFKRPLNPQEVLSLTVEIINPNNVANESNLNNNSKTVRLICRKKK